MLLTLSLREPRSDAITCMFIDLTQIGLVGIESTPVLCFTTLLESIPFAQENAVLRPLQILSEGATVTADAA